MTPKEKAIELFNKYKHGVDIVGWRLCEYDTCSRQCALIAVDEILNCTVIKFTERGSFTYEDKYWEQVKQEIEKL